VIPFEGKGLQREKKQRLLAEKLWNATFFKQGERGRRRRPLLVKKKRRLPTEQRKGEKNPVWMCPLAGEMGVINISRNGKQFSEKEKRCIKREEKEEKADQDGGEKGALMSRRGSLDLQGRLASIKELFLCWRDALLFHQGKSTAI